MSIDADGELQRVLRHARERRAHEHADDDDENERGRGTERGEPDAALCALPKVITMNATSSPSRSTPLNASVKPYQSSPARCRRRGAPASCELAREDRLLVVQRLEAAGAQDRLAQPLQAEGEQQRADDEAQGVDRDDASAPAERGDDHARARASRPRPGERGAPAARDADREHDRERLDELDRAREKRGCDQEPEVTVGGHSGTALRFAFEKCSCDDLAAELQGRRDLAVLLREVAGEDREALDLLDAHAVAVDVVDDLLHELLWVSAGRCDLGVVDRDQRGDVGPPVADDDRLRDEARCLQRVLEVLRRDVLAAGGDDQILLAVGDLQEAVRVDLAEVAGAEPAVVGEGRCRRLGILVVAAEDGVAAHEDLAVLVEPDLAALDGAADRAEVEVVGVVDAQRARRLREPVALDRRACRASGRTRAHRAERRRAGDADA